MVDGHGLFLSAHYLCDGKQENALLSWSSFSLRWVLCAWDSRTGLPLFPWSQIILHMFGSSSMGRVVRKKKKLNLNFTYTTNNFSALVWVINAYGSMIPILTDQKLKLKEGNSP